MKITLLILMIYIAAGMTFLVLNDTTQEAEATQIETKYIEVIKEVPVKFDYQTFEVTAYTAGIESTGKTPDHPQYRITASGEYAVEGYTIACPLSMAFGTKIYFPDYELIYTCQDRGSAITDGHLDIFVEDVERALEFGRRQMKGLILP